jgi:hypothetical protein
MFQECDMPRETRKGGKVVTIPLAPRTARVIDLAVGRRRPVNDPAAGKLRPAAAAAGRSRPQP